MQFWHRARVCQKTLTYHSKRRFSEFQRFTQQKLRYSQTSHISQTKQGDVGEMRQELQNKHEPQFQALNKAQNVQEILDIFHSAEVPDNSLFTKTMNFLTKHKAPEEAIKLWHSHRHGIDLLNEKCFAAALSAIASLQSLSPRDLDVAGEMWKHMRFCEIYEADAATFNIMLRIYGRARSELGIRFWETIPREKRDVSNYTAMIELCYACERYESGIETYETLVSDGKNPSALTFVATMKCYAKVRDRSRGLYFVKKFQRWCIKWGYSFWEEPLFHNAMMTLFLEHKDFSHAQRYVENLELKADWIKSGKETSASFQIYNTLAAIAEETSNHDFADQIFEKCVNEGLIDLGHYSTSRTDAQRVEMSTLQPQTCIVALRYVLKRIAEESKSDASILDWPLALNIVSQNQNEKIPRNRSQLEAFIKANPPLSIKEHLKNSEMDIVGFSIKEDSLKEYIKN